MNIFVNPAEHRPRAGWRILLQFILMLLLTGLGSLVFQFSGFEPGRVLRVGTAFAGIVLSIWIAARYIDRRPFREYGIQFNKNRGLEFTAGTCIGAIAIGAVFVVEWASGWIVITGFGWERASDTSFVWMLSGYGLAMLMVAFYEELLSRGYQILNLAEGLRYEQLGVRGAVIIAVLLTSSLFGLLHAGNPNATGVSTVNIMLAGIVLALPYLFTGSLALPAGLHFSWNFFQGGVFGFAVSGINFRTSILQIEQRGSDLWTGGAFGPEAGFAGLMGMTVMILCTLIYIRRTGYALTIHRRFKKDFKPRRNSDEQGL